MAAKTNAAHAALLRDLSAHARNDSDGELALAVLTLQSPTVAIFEQAFAWAKAIAALSACQNKDLGHALRAPRSRLTTSYLLVSSRLMMRAVRALDATQAQLEAAA